MSARKLKKNRSLPIESYPARMNVAQVAEFLNVTDSHVATLIRSGALPAIDIGTRPGTNYYRVIREDVVAFLAKNKAK
jgi:excisionase family DNA binding protein